MRAFVIVESCGPIESDTARVPAHRTEVVNNVATVNHEHTLSTEGRKLGTQLEVVLEWFVGVYRQLHHRDGRVGESVHQYRPGAVVDAPTVNIGTPPRGCDDVADLLSELW